MSDIGKNSIDTNTCVETIMSIVDKTACLLALDDVVSLAKEKRVYVSCKCIACGIAKKCTVVPLRCMSSNNILKIAHVLKKGQSAQTG